MTCIAVVRDEDGTVWMGADSAVLRQGTQNSAGQPKIFALPNGVYLGRSGASWPGEVLRNGFDAPALPPDADALHWMANVFVPAAKERLRATEAWEEDRDEDGWVRGTRGIFLAVVKGRIFELSQTCEVTELAGPYHACGNGEDPALGALYALGETNTGLTPQSRLTIALEAASRHRENVAPPFYIIECRNLSPADAR